MAVSGAARVAIIVPVFGNWGDTCECVQLLVDQGVEGCLIYVADDGSPEEPPARLFDSGQVVYRRGEHVGFAANCNRVAELALAEGASHLLLLNNDTLMGPRFIRAWQAVAESHARTIVSPIIYTADDSPRVWHSGGRKTVWAPFTRHRRHFVTPTSVDLVCGCCLLVPGAVWSTLGGFDARYAMYFEDFDLCLRARQAGFEVVVLPDADLAVRHKVSGSFRGSPWRKERMMIGSRRRFVGQHYFGVERVACRLLEWPYLVSRIVANMPCLPDGVTLLEAIRGKN